MYSLPVLSAPTGNHDVFCEWGGERIARKTNLIRDGLFNNCISGALLPTSEDRDILPRTEARPVDILLADWTGGKDTALDITVEDPLNQQSLATLSEGLKGTVSRKILLA